MKGILFENLSVDKFSTNIWAQFFLLALQEFKIYSGNFSSGSFETGTP